MARWIVAGFILAEVAGFALMGRAVGVLGVLGLVVLAAVAGAALLRRRGGGALAALRGALGSGRDPIPALLRGGFGVLAGLLLVLPGFLSDLLAILLLLPPVQRALARRAAVRGRVRGRVPAAPMRARPGMTRPGMAPDVPDADWEELPRSDPDPHPGPRRPPSGWTRR